MRAATGILVAIAVIFVAGCSSQPQRIGPVTESFDNLDGATIELVVGQALNINTGDVAEESFVGTVEDETVAIFVPGKQTAPRRSIRA